MKTIPIILGLLFVATSTMATDTMRSKARALQLPTLQYRDVTLRQILTDIQEKSVSVDPEGTGVNLVIRLDDDQADRKLTMTIKTPTIERALTLLAATAALYIRYDPGAIIIQKSRSVTGN